MPEQPPAAAEARSIVIEGELARIQHTVVERHVRTADLLNELAKLQPLSTGLLPRNCIAFARITGERGHLVTVFAIERPAGMYPIRFKEGRSNDDPDDKKIQEIELSWPHTQWFVTHVGAAIASLHITCTRCPIESLDDDLFVLPMPNIYDSGHGAVCLGNLTVPDGPCPATRTDRLIEEVLGSLWNSDLEYNLEPLGVESLAQWAEKSALDPEIGAKFNYRPHRAKTFGALLDSRLEGER